MASWSTRDIVASGVDVELQSHLNGLSTGTYDAFDSVFMEKIEKKLELARCHLKMLKNAQQGINALPTEVLAHVLGFLDELRGMVNVEGLHLASAHKSRALLAVTAVCRQWRTVAFTTPNLWNHIHVHRDLRSFESRSCTLSGNLPLTVYFSDDTNIAAGTGPLTALQVISEHSGRLEKLFMSVVWPVDSPYWRELQGEAPMLKILQIAGSGPPAAHIGAALPNLFGSPACIEEVLVSWYAPPVGGLFKDLRSLVLHGQRLADGEQSGFCCLLPVIAESPHLHELIIGCWMLEATGQHQSNLPFLDNPVSLPKLRTLGLVCEGWFQGSTDDIATFLSCICIPDSASRYIITTGGYRWRPSLYELVHNGRPQPNEPRTIRKLQIASSKDTNGRLAFALEGETVTITTNIHAELRSAFFASGMLSEVEDLVLVALYPHPSLLEFQNFFASLPSLRHISISGPTRGSALIIQVVNALGRVTGKRDSPVAQDTFLCPLLTSISFLYYDPGRLPQWDNDDLRVDGTMVALLAGDRAQGGLPLERVVVERCTEDHLEWLQEIVTSAVSIKRWEGYPGDYHERLILKDMFEKVQRPSLRNP